jgi:hypothetical protein
MVRHPLVDVAREIIQTSGRLEAFDPAGGRPGAARAPVPERSIASGSWIGVAPWVDSLTRPSGPFPHATPSAAASHHHCLVMSPLCAVTTSIPGWCPSRRADGRSSRLRPGVDALARLSPTCHRPTRPSSNRRPHSATTKAVLLPRDPGVAVGRSPLVAPDGERIPLPYQLAGFAAHIMESSSVLQCPR